MKTRLLWSVFPIVLAILILAGNTAEAASVGISIGGGHRYSNGGAVIQYRTSDPAYTTWYPDYETTYVAPPVYYTTPSYVYDSTPYVYSSPSVDFGGWYGSGGGRHYGGYGRSGHSSGGSHRR